MIFQTLDDKTECVGIYTDNQLLFNIEEFPDTLTSTWKYAPYLRDQDVEYISLYLEGAPLTEHVPEYLQDDWSDVSRKISAFKRSLSISHVDMAQNCFFDLVPSRFLIEFCEVKNKITEHILKTLPRPRRYEFYKHISILLGDIRSQTIKIDPRILGTYASDPKLGAHARKILECAPYVDYNQFGTKTGRLTTARDTFPILTMNKVFRPAVLPSNDCFVEMDFNGAEVRTLLGMLNKPQPAEDVHDFHLTEIFKNLTTRDEAKVAFFAWLYGSRAAASSPEAAALEKYYDKQQLLDTYWQNETVVTPFRKEIHGVDRHYALNYLVQSTSAELTLKQALKIDHVLRTRGTGSRIAFIIHDAIVLDMKNEDMHLYKMLHRLMSSTNFGTFGVNVKKGLTLGSMKEEAIG
tara:strand:- start:1568 stop:2788 length:1221 start_codon:yes stop_codon:yes gene_type:complete